VKNICRLFFLFFLLTIFFQFFKIKPVRANDEFQTNFDIRYQVDENGSVNVREQITLTNKISSVYVTQYSLTLPSEIKNIKVFDGKGPCKISVSQDSNTTLIIINFNQQVIGIGKNLIFNLTYDSPDTAKKNGEVWEINLPKLSALTKVDNYNVSLAIPNSFGKAAFIRPDPVEELTEDNFKVYRFVKSQLENSGVNAVFGPFQIFDFTLFYHLENKNFILGETEIALPPDTAFQQIIFKEIEPKPLNIRVDNDGNWLAKYRLSPKEKIQIKFTGKVKILAQPQRVLATPSQENLEKNLAEAPYWETNNETIYQLAQKLKTPKAIYQYVVSNLKYNFDRAKDGAPRLGALEALKNPEQAICMEFTDLFITLCRAAGIPAREINGFAYTDDIHLRPLSLMFDVLHSWPEYYDEKEQIWRPVDPTWEKTTGGVDYFYQTNLNHFAFAIHGEDSQNPYPAGSYKLDDYSGKDVQVVFGDYQEEEKVNLKTLFEIPKKIFWGENKKGKIIIANEGEIAAYKIDVKINAENLIIKTGLKENIEVLPPFAFIEIPLEIKHKGFFNSGNGLFTVSVNNESFQIKIGIDSLLTQIILPLGGFLLTLGTLILLIKKKF